MKNYLRITCSVLCATLLMGPLSAADNSMKSKESICFGTQLNAKKQIAESHKLAKSLVNPKSANWRAKGDQHRTYYFAEAGTEMPYRICVPEDWDGKTKLPLVMFLHGGWSNENTYLDEHDKQLVRLANAHGCLLVSPLGGHAAYGNFLMLPAVFGRPDEAEKVLARVNDDRRRAQDLSEKDVINVLELVLAEYPVKRNCMFLTGHSMGSGGTWYIGGKYASYWRALAPMSGPFVTEEGYPWKNLKKKPLFVTEGTRAGASLQGSRDLHQWLKANGFDVTYKEVDADHPGMVPLMLPDVFDFIDRYCK